MVSNIIEKEIDYTSKQIKDIPEEGKDFLKKVLCKDPNQRLTANQAFDHQ